MIFADKLIALRKQNGLSQEEVAASLNVSRQSVSKWESGISIPDLDKIVKLSQLFSVSTDYLIKDEIESISITEQESENKAFVVSLEDANVYLDEVERRAPKLGGGVSILICSPVVLLIMGALTDHKILSENLACSIGICVLLLMVALGVSILIANGMPLEKYEFLEKEAIELMYGIKGVVEKRKKAYEKTYQISVITGIVLCIVGVIPLMMALGFGETSWGIVLGVCMILIAVSAAVFLFVRSGYIRSSYDKLLQSGDYTAEKKKSAKKAGFFPPFYWTLTTALYLAVSFTQNNWNQSWIIWPIAGVLFAALYGLIRFIVSRKYE